MIHPAPVQPLVPSHVAATTELAPYRLRSAGNCLYDILAP
jgi:hypothetical protein